MPPLVAVPNVLRAQLLWSDAADLDVSTGFFFRYSGSAPSAVDATTLAGKIFTAAHPFMEIALASVDLRGVRVTDLSSNMGGDGTHVETDPGTGGGDALPGGIGPLVNYSIARRYRGGKPRSYFPLFAAADLLTRQSWKPASIAAMGTAFSAFIGQVLGSTAGPTTITAHVNVSYYAGFTNIPGTETKRAKVVSKPRETPVVDDILGFGVSAIPGSQRRRNRV